ncbi:phosphoglycerate kinase [Candidatus Woesearchaeota archaeon]|nr:phosphoglycerate kinase [Candidatus Woesearchaeota archaeon]
MQFFTLKDFDFKDKRVLIRVDMNVPVDDKGKIINDKKIRSSLPTIEYILNKGGKVVLMSQLGRPNGEIVKHLRLNNVAKRLSKLLRRDVKKLNDCVDIKLTDDDIIMLENLRFHKEEEMNDEGFGKKLASLADIYVNDAFGTSHRAHASFVAVTKFLPSVAGLLLEKEIHILSEAMENPEKPCVAVLGGAKISDKLGLIHNLLRKVDKILLGGAMVFTFFKAQGYNVGESLVEDDKLELVEDLMFRKRIILPVDVVVGDKMIKNAKSKVVSINKIPKSWMGLDIGPKTIELFKNELANSKTVIWNGPLGAFEYPKFEEGTKKITEFIAGLDANTIAGGGETNSALEKYKLSDKFTYVSTGGGAFLEFIQGKTLPGISALIHNCDHINSQNRD